MCNAGFAVGFLDECPAIFCARSQYSIAIYYDLAMSLALVLHCIHLIFLTIYIPSLRQIEKRFQSEISDLELDLGKKQRKALRGT